MAKEKQKKKEEIVEEEFVEEKSENITEEISEVEKLKKELSEKNDLLLRTLAEYDNFRKRSIKEKEQAYRDSKAVVLTELLPIIDNFERATENAKADEANFESYKKGIEMIFSQFSKAITDFGIQPFGEVGEEFNPNQHNAVMHIEDEAFGENTIAEVFTKGYKLGDRVLRTAIVKVAN